MTKEEKQSLKRAKIVRAMDTLARCINNEMIFERWLLSGIADNDITDNTTSVDIISAGYCTDEEFKNLMSLFLKLMYKASGDGGLYAEGVVSATRQIEWR